MRKSLFVVFILTVLLNSDNSLLHGKFDDELLENIDVTREDISLALLLIFVIFPGFLDNLKKQK